MLANIIRNAKKTSAAPATDPYFSSVSLLLHMDGANGSISFVDSGPNAIALTAAGDAKISTTQSKFGGASGAFDGTGDYLTSASNSAFAYGTGDFTWEFWFNSNSWAAGNNYLMDHGASTTAGAIQYYSGIMRYYNTSTGTASSLYTTGFGSGLSTGVWYHLAASRQAGVTRLFRDGVLISSASDAYNYPANRIVVGAAGSLGAPFNGYLDDLRVTKYARYTASFTPSAQALPEYLAGNDRYFSNVSLLLHMDGASGSTSFLDNSLTGYTITKYGTAAVSTTQSKYGGASAYFDGSGARLGLSTTAIDFGAGDFTAECWVYLNAAPSSDYGQVIGKQVYGTSCSWLIHITAARVLSFLWNNGVNVLSSGTALNLNQWYHIAVSRSGSTVRIFVDGTQVASGAISYTFASSTEFTVGSSSNDNANARLNAYIDDVRLTKLARYVSAFTPPSQAFPNA